MSIEYLQTLAPERERLVAAVEKARTVIDIVGTPNAPASLGYQGIVDPVEHAIRAYAIGRVRQRLTEKALPYLTGRITQIDEVISSDSTFSALREAAAGVKKLFGAGYVTESEVRQTEKAFVDVMERLGIADALNTKPENLLVNYKHLEWSEELLNLRATVDNVKYAWRTGSMVAKNNMGTLLDRANFTMVGRMERFSIDEFAQTLLGLFDRSFGTYNRSEASVYRSTHKMGRHRHDPYRRFEGCLNPRQIRMLINCFGLGGKKVNIKEAGMLEGILNADAALRFAVVKMVQCLVP